VAYRAEIEIGVRGQDRLNKLQNQISKLANQITRINDQSIFDAVEPRAVQSIQNYSNALSVAAANLREAALGQKEETTAIRQYVDILTDSNAAQKRQNNLINEEIARRNAATTAIREQVEANVALSRASREASAFSDKDPVGKSIRRRLRKLAGDPSAYASPIGPAESPLQGQTSPVEERIRRTIQGRQEQLKLDQALFELERKSAERLNAQVNFRQNLVSLQENMVAGAREVLDLIAQQNQKLAEQERKAQFLSGKSGALQQGPLAGPGAMGFPVALPMSKVEQLGSARAAEIRDRYQALFLRRQERLFGLKQGEKTLQVQLRSLEQQSIDLAADKTREQEELVALKEKELRISKEGALIAGRFSPIGGAANIPGSPAFLRAQKQKRGAAISSGIIGGAFPLLFGQGPAAAVGGGLGGIAGGLLGGGLGFGLSLVGTALGDAIQKSLDLEKALKKLNTQLGSVGAQSKITYTDIEKLAGALKVSKEEALSAVQAFGAYGDSAIALAQAFTGVGDLATFQTIGSAGLDQESALRAIVQLRNLIGNEAAKELALNLTVNGAVGTQEKLLTLVLQKQFDVNVETAKNVGLWDYVRSGIAQSLALAISLSEALRNMPTLPGQTSMFKNLPDLSGLQSQLAERTPESYAEERLADIAKLRDDILESLKTETDVQDTLNKLLDSYTKSTKQLEEQKERERQRVEKVIRDQATLTQTLEIQSKYSTAIFNAEQEKDKLLARRLQGEEQLELLAVETAAKLVEEKDNAAKVAISKAQQAKAALIIKNTTQDLVALEREHRKFVADTLADLKYEVDYQSAVTRERREQLELEKAIRKAKGQGIKGDDLKQVEALTKQRQEQQRPIRQYMKQLEDSLNDTEGQIVQLAQAIETELGSAMSNAITGLVTGTQTVEEAFSQMFANIGKAFIDMATKLLAQQLILTIFKSIMGPTLGGGGGGLPGLNMPTGIGDSYTSFLGFAEGGYPPVGQPSIVGEKGPELFVPGQPGMIVPNDVFEATRSAIGGGGGGSAAFDENREALNSVTTLNRERQVERLLTSGATSTEIRYSRVGSGDLPFVTEENMLQATRVAAQEGARLGQARTLAALKNNPGTRRSVGI
jgi:hypothetical protein